MTTERILCSVLTDDVQRARRTYTELFGLEVVAEPHDTEYGQRQVLLRDPDGTLVDVSAPVAPLASEYR